MYFSKDVYSSMKEISILEVIVSRNTVINCVNHVLFLKNFILFFVKPYLLSFVVILLSQWKFQQDCTMDDQYNLLSPEQSCHRKALHE